MEHQYLDSNGLAIIAKHVNARLKTVSEMPAASEKLGVCLYTGETSDGYVKGHIYQSVAEGEAYTWKDVTPLPEAPIVVKGTVAAEDLPDPSAAAIGDMYNISNDFTTTDAFVHSGVFEKAGSNVYCIEIEQGEGDNKTTVKKWDVFAMFITDQSYDAESTSAQSGVAVAQAVADRLHAVKTMPGFAPQGEVIAYIGENTSDYIKGHLYQASTAANSTEWVASSIPKIPNNISNSQANGRNIWSDGENSYFSYDSYNYVYDRVNNEWVSKNNIPRGQKLNIGDDVYSFDDNGNYYILKKGSSDWEAKTYNKNGMNLMQSFWTDGEDIFYSHYSPASTATTYNHQLRFNKGTSTFTPVTWNVVRISEDGTVTSLSNNLKTELTTDHIWVHEGTTYCIYNDDCYILDKENSRWVYKAYWKISGITIYGSRLWSDGDNIYYSNGTSNYILDKDTFKWKNQTWIGNDRLDGQYIWLDHNSVHYFYNNADYMLPLKSSWDDLTIAAAPVKTLSDEDVEAAFA